jgi:hypothetical protein
VWLLRPYTAFQAASLAILPTGARLIEKITVRVARSCAVNLFICVCLPDLQYVDGLGELLL